MTTITDRIAIQRPAADVFAFVSNYENDPAWREGVVEMRQSEPGPARTGMTTREVIELLGNTLVITARVTVEEPGRRVAFQVIDGPIPVAGYRLVEESDGESHFTYHLTADLSGPYEQIAPQLIADVRERIERDLHRLKRLLERR